MIWIRLARLRGGAQVDYLGGELLARLLLDAPAHGRADAPERSTRVLLLDHSVLA